jgi:photosystem II stability/assembly factor-like uncharacterized protein
VLPGAEGIRVKAWIAKSRGLDAASVTAIAVDPLRPDTLYVGADALWKSTDAGRTWFPSSRGITNLGVDSIAVDPRREGVVYATAYQLFGSVDGGRHFRSLAAPEGGFDVFHDVAVAPSDPDVVYVLDAARLVKTTDAGRTFAELPAAPPTAAFAIAADDAAKVYVLSSDGHVFATEDGGATFRAADSGVPSDGFAFDSTLAVDPVDSNVVYVGVHRRGLFRSQDGGASWSPVGASVSGGTAYTQIAIDAESRGRTFLVADLFPRPGSLLRSEDGGETFTPTASPFPSPAPGGPDIPYRGTVALDPSRPKRVYVGDPTGFYRSDDDLASFALSVRGLHDVSINQLAVDRQRPGTLYVAAQRGLFTTTTGGTSWTRNATFPAYGAAAVVTDPDAGGVAYASTLAISSANVLTQQKLFVTRDAGATWSDFGARIPGSVYFVTPLGVAPGHSEIVFSLAAEFRAPEFLFRTNDGGASWARSIAPVPSLASFVALSPDHLFAVIGGKVSESTGGGLAFETLDAGLGSVAALAVDTAHPGTLYAVAFDRMDAASPVGLRRSTDGGKTWVAPSPDLADVPVSEVSVGADGRVYVVRGAPSEPRTPYVSADGGETFVRASDGLDTVFVDGVVADPTTPCVAYLTTAEGVFGTSTAAGTCAAP